MVLFACFFVQSAGAALHHAVVLKHSGNGAKEAFHIQPKAQMLHIPAVQLGLLGNFQLVAAMDLCPAGQARRTSFAWYLSRSASRSYWFHKAGRGPMTAISPTKMFHSWGSSSRLVLRRK